MHSERSVMSTAELEALPVGTLFSVKGSIVDPYGRYFTINGTTTWRISSPGYATQEPHSRRTIGKNVGWFASDSEYTCEGMSPLIHIYPAR